MLSGSRSGVRLYAVETTVGVGLDVEIELRHGDVAVDDDTALFKRVCNWLNVMT